MSAFQNNFNNTNQIAAGGNNRVATLSLHDPEFKNLITVPLSAVHHMPPSHLEISRLVLCRKFDPRDSANSCPMGDTCKFVHIDMGCPELTVQSIHVNYAYRSLEEVAHERLPAGESLAVMAPNNRAPSQLVPSEMVLVTKGAIQRHNSKGPLSHCAHYFYNRMCNRGDRCGFIHAVYIDEKATEFQRAPPRAGASCAVTAPVIPNAMPASIPRSVNPVIPSLHVVPGDASASAPHNTNNNTSATSSNHNGTSSHKITTLGHSLGSSASSNDLSESPRSEHSGQMSGAGSSSYSTARVYRHNPYSLIETVLLVDQRV